MPGISGEDGRHLDREGGSKAFQKHRHPPWPSTPSQLPSHRMEPVLPTQDADSKARAGHALTLNHGGARSTCYPGPSCRFILNKLGEDCGQTGVAVGGPGRLPTEQQSACQSTPESSPPLAPSIAPGFSASPGFLSFSFSLHRQHTLLCPHSLWKMASVVLFSFRVTEVQRGAEEQSTMQFQLMSLDVTTHSCQHTVLAAARY